MEKDNNLIYANSYIKNVSNYKEINLSNANINCKYKIKKVICNGKIERRLYDLGFINGQSVKIVKKSIFGGVYLIEIMFGLLAVKKKEIEKIWVTKV